MSYQTLSIKNIINQIDHNKVFLPALQRKFVWKKRQIELLFDSLMRQYPIGAFLFWRLPKKEASEYVFYEFLRNYDSRSPYNVRREKRFSHDEIIGVLDGQQRLSSMYIGLMGTHRTKIRYRRYDDDSAYPAKELYLNLFSLPYLLNTRTQKIELDESKDFEFKFLTTADAQQKKRSVDGGQGSVLWIKVGDSLNWDEDYDGDFILEQIEREHNLDLGQKSYLTSQKRFINKALQTLHNRIYDKNLLSYFEVNKTDLEDVLRIFVRVNSGGTVLNKTDLLFSTIVATWPDGRDSIERLLKDINKKGDGFNFGNEFLMRCCLVLNDLPVLYKVNSFKSSNVETIKKTWEKLSDAIKTTTDVLVELGFSGELLTSQNAVLPIAYHIFKGGDLSAESKKNMRLYLVHSLLKRIFSNSQESLIQAFRKLQSIEQGDNKGVYSLRQKNFSFDIFASAELPGGKSLKIYHNELDALLEVKKGSTSFYLLSLLSPDLRFHQQKFAQDHIHPQVKFTSEDMTKARIPEEDHTRVLELRDTLPNLQLLETRWNSSKNAEPLISWISKYSEQDQRYIKQSGFFPEGVGLEFSNFLDFHAKRKSLLRQKLLDELAMSEDKLQQFPNVEDEDEEFFQEEMA